MGEHRLVDMHRAPRSAGGAAGEMKQRQILEAGSGAALLGTRSPHRLTEVDRTLDRLGWIAVDQQHMLQAGQLIPPIGDFTAI
jgi:hypothetical protein